MHILYQKKGYAGIVHAQAIVHQPHSKLTELHDEMLNLLRNSILIANDPFIHLVKKAGRATTPLAVLAEYLSLKHLIRVWSCIHVNQLIFKPTSIRAHKIIMQAGTIKPWARVRKTSTDVLFITEGDHHLVQAVVEDTVDLIAMFFGGAISSCIVSETLHERFLP